MSYPYTHAAWIRVRKNTKSGRALENDSDSDHFFLNVNNIESFYSDKDDGFECIRIWMSSGHSVCAFCSINDLINKIKAALDFLKREYDTSSSIPLGPM